MCSFILIGAIKGDYYKEWKNEHDTKSFISFKYFIWNRAI